MSVLLSDYLTYKLVGEDSYIAIDVRGVAGAIIVRGRLADIGSTSDEWLYSDLGSALDAFATYAGVGDPTGWIRHSPAAPPADLSSDETDGNRVGSLDSL